MAIPNVMVMVRVMVRVMVMVMVMMMVIPNVMMRLGQGWQRLDIKQQWL